MNIAFGDRDGEGECYTLFVHNSPAVFSESTRCVLWQQDYNLCQKINGLV